MVSKFEHLDAPMPKMELKMTKYMYRVPVKTSYSTLVLSSSQLFSAEYSSVLYGDYKKGFKIWAPRCPNAKNGAQSY